MSAESAASAPLKISIVTPNYNGAEFLRHTLDSVLSQNYPELEYIVVDGASADDSRAIIESCRSDLAHYICEPDNGHADALNKGFALASGEIMGWINSDDTLLPGTLATIDKVFRARPDIEWVTGRATSMNEEGEIGWISPARPWSRLRFLCGDYRWIQQESTFWRRSLWERAGSRLDTNYKLANDFELWTRFFRHAELHSLDKSLGVFRVRTGQRSVVHRKRYETEMRSVIAREFAQIEPEFREAFHTVLPAAPTELAADEVGRLHTQLSVCDPPLIKARDIQNLGREKRAAIAPVPIANPVARASRPSDLSRFRRIHVGQRCFIMGNGPSLNRMDLSRLDGEIVFACNAVFLLFDRLRWRPQYYTCVDSRVLPDRATDIDRMLTANPHMTGFFPAVIEEHAGERRRYPTRTVLATAPNRFYFREAWNSLDNPPTSMFSVDINAHVVQPYTVAITMLQIAAYMGFSEIYLIGCDTNYIMPEGLRREGEEDSAALVSTRDNDPNHFDRRYFGKGRKWHDPQPDKMIEHYGYAKQVLDALGVHVYNATLGGRLEVFPRIDFEEVLARARVRPRVAETALQPEQDATPNETESHEEVRVSRWAALAARAKTIAFSLAGMAWRARLALSAAVTVSALVFAISLLPEFAGARIALWVALGAALWFGSLGFLALRMRSYLVEATNQLREVSQSSAACQIRLAEIELELEEVRLGLDKKTASR